MKALIKAHEMIAKQISFLQTFIDDCEKILAKAKADPILFDAHSKAMRDCEDELEAAKLVLNQYEIALQNLND